jgi:hypothetical protein
MQTSQAEMTDYSLARAIHLFAINTQISQSEMVNYSIECVTHRYRQEEVLTAWRALLANHVDCPERIYQTPEYFDYLMATSDGVDRPEVYIVRSQSEGQIVGVIPVRGRRHPLDFRLREHLLAQPKLRVIAVLGSVALLPAGEQLFEAVMDYLLQQFPEASAISFSALPIGDRSDRTTYIPPVLYEKYGLYVFNGWRECHTIPLPSSFDEYLRQFSSKKRYNLGRQVRLLREFAGNIYLRRISSPSDIPALMGACAIFSPKLQMLSEDKYIALAERDLLLSYVLYAGDQVCSLILGTRSSFNWHIHNVFYLSTIQHLSVGTTTLHLSIEDVLKQDQFISIDLGYGSPVHSYQSSNKTVVRGHVLLLRKTFRNNFLCGLHNFFGKTIEFIKLLRNRNRS